MGFRAWNLMNFQQMQVTQTKFSSADVFFRVVVNQLLTEIQK